MPRRAGGKYKGLITRAKSEDTIALEAEEKEARLRARTLQRAQDLKRRQATDGHSLQKSAQEEKEAKMERIMNLLMGGKKSLPKFFSFWQVGVRNIRKERAMRNREFNWRQSCVNPDTLNDGHCHACALLESPDFMMPFEYIQRQAGLMAQSRSTGQLPLQFAKPGTDPRLKYLNRRFSKATVGDAFIGPNGPSQLVKSGQTESLPTLPAALDPKQVAAEKEKQRQLQLAQTQQLRPSWLPTQDNVQIGFHHTTGRPVKFDPATMRMEFLPTSNDQAWRNSVLPGGDRYLLLR